jgi:leader peptidase (prepilin peptidase)/N-methyltransferase
MLEAILAVPFGLAFGSFSTVVVARIPAGDSVVKPRSRCTACGAEIRARDNIPVVSWILLRGRCRSCDARISAVYPLTELLTATLFVGAFIAYQNLWIAFMMGTFVALMPAIALIDARHKIIPNRIVYPSLIGFGAYITLAWMAGAPVSVLNAAIGFLVYGGSLFLVALISPRGMGMGDVKLVALIGVVLGSLGLRYVGVAAGAGILLGGVAAIGALLVGKDRKGTIPFGPFLAAGALVAAFWGPAIADAYLRLAG